MTPGLRVALFDAYPHLLGGAQRTMLSVAVELLARDHAPTVIVPADGPVASHARSHQVPVVIAPIPAALGRFGRTTTGRHRVTATATLPLAWARLRRALMTARPDVVHTNDHRGVLLMAPPARLLRTPVVWHAHSVDVAGSAIERSAGRLVAAVVAPSAAAVSGLAHLPARTETTIVPVPIDDAVRVIGPATPDPAGPIVTAARLHPTKGVDLALRAIAQLRSGGQPAHLDVYGAPQPGADSYAAELHALAHELGVETDVTFHGQVEHPHRRWLGAALYLQTSHAETFGMAVAEAMTLGLPVVATRVGGLPELIDDGRTGVLAPAGDVDAIARAISGLLRDPDRARAMGEAARTATAGLTPERTVDALLAVWQRAVAG